MRAFRAYSVELASTTVHIFDENVMIWLKMRAFRVYSFELTSTTVHILDENVKILTGILIKIQKIDAMGENVHTSSRNEYPFLRFFAGIS